ncbi:sulfurtransferase TusA family protein [Thiohalomonas denitrificans]|nr:sulfurtransferase TusA family protein [Thiohalomonas denitrificans]
MLSRKQEATVLAVPHTVTLPQTGEVTISRTLDCIGAACPRPQLLTMRVLDELEEGEVIELLSDNPATVETLPALMFSQGGTHMATLKRGDHWRIYMRKGVYEVPKKRF